MRPRRISTANLRPTAGVVSRTLRLHQSRAYNRSASYEDKALRMRTYDSMRVAAAATGVFMAKTTLRLAAP